MVQSSIGQLVSTYVWALRGVSPIFMKIPNHVSSIEISRHPTFSLTKTWEQKLQILVSHASILMNKATSQHCTLRARCKLFNESPNLKWLHDVFFSKSSKIQICNPYVHDYTYIFMYEYCIYITCWVQKHDWIAWPRCRGYMAPEYATQGQLSEKVDVYSFGVLMLEVVTGRKNIDFSLPSEEIYILAWVRDLPL